MKRNLQTSPMSLLNALTPKRVDPLRSLTTHRCDENQEHNRLEHTRLAHKQLVRNRLAIEMPGVAKGVTQEIQLLEGNPNPHAAKR